MKKFLSIAIVVFALNVFPVTVSAQETTLPTAPTEEVQLPIGESQDPNKPADESTTTDTTSQDDQQVFLNGLLAGGLVGVAVGGIVAWLFKDKFVK